MEHAQVGALAEEFRSKLNLDAPRLGTVEAVEELATAVCGAWMVIEAVPERLEQAGDDHPGRDQVQQHERGDVGPEKGEDAGGDSDDAFQDQPAAPPAGQAATDDERGRASRPSTTA
jgi:hypothetical protein